MNREIQAIEKVKHLWETWDIRSFILASLFMQGLLTFLAPLRKSSSSSLLRLLIWVLYLSADAIALLIIGWISSNEGDSPERKELLAFWASFLLLHLGGPDTITALALEDNELWNRHALQLATQVCITAYVYFQSIRLNNLGFPAMLMFFAGFIKYLERTRALYLASIDNFRDSLVAKPEAGIHYATMLMEEYLFAKQANHIIPTSIAGFKGGINCRFQRKMTLFKEREITDVDTDDEEMMTHDDMVIEAYRFYEMYRALLADGFLRLNDRAASMRFFLDRFGLQGLRIIEIELNLIYDVFHTKLSLLQRKQAFTRVLCFLSVTASLLCFRSKDTSIYHNVDVIITFILLVGAIVLDIFSAVMYVVSDWWIIISADATKLQHYYCQSLMLLIFKLSKWARRPHRRRWSEYISKYNILKRWFRKPPSIFNFSYVFSIKQIREILIGFLYVEGQVVDEQLMKFVMKELRNKGSLAREMELAKEVCSARGNLVLEDEYFLASECLSPWTVAIDYDESLLIWHLATDICFWTDVASTSEHRRFSKALSDYMSYLLLRQQKLVSSVVGMIDTRFDDTCAEAKTFMDHESIDINCLADLWCKAKKSISKLCCQTTSGQDELPSQKEESKFFQQFCNKVLEVKVDVQPPIISKSVLFDACRLARQLEIFGERQWEITSKVWVELLCYAAVRCTPRSHIAQLSQGGELITIVWLYMAHLGLGDRFQQQKGFEFTKFIVQK